MPLFPPWPKPNPLDWSKFRPKLVQHGSPIRLGCAHDLPQGVTNTVGEVADEDWAAIENCLAIIRQCQMADGMIRIKGDGDPVWTMPYFSNFAAMAILAANDLRPNPLDVHRVERGYCGTPRTRSRTARSATGGHGRFLPLQRPPRLHRFLRRDLPDGRAAYQQAIQGQPAPKIIQAARMALGAIAAVRNRTG